MISITAIALLHRRIINRGRGDTVGAQWRAACRSKEGSLHKKTRHASALRLLTSERLQATNVQMLMCSARRQFPSWHFLAGLSVSGDNWRVQKKTRLTMPARLALALACTVVSKPSKIQFFFCYHLFLFTWCTLRALLFISLINRLGSYPLAWRSEKQALCSLRESVRVVQALGKKYCALVKPTTTLESFKEYLTFASKPL